METIRYAIFRHNGTCGHVFRKKVELVGSNYKTYKGTMSAWPLELCKCQKAIYGKVIRGTVNQDVKCDGKCRSAKGCNCDCSCGGENHGSNY